MSAEVGGAAASAAPVALHIYWQRGVDYDEHGRVVRRLGGDGLSWGGKLLKDILGVYHVGLEVYQDEYTFGNSRAPGCRRLGSEASGVFRHDPKFPGPHCVFKQAVSLGSTTKTRLEVASICLSLGDGSFTQCSYSRVHHNCVDFARALAAKLGAEDLPSWCYRGAAAARFLGIGGSPKGGEEEEDEEDEEDEEVESPGPHIPADAFKIGQRVSYFSRSAGRWVPAEVQGYNESPANVPGVAVFWSYRLDIQPQAPPSHVSPAEGAPQESPTSPRQAGFRVMPEDEGRLRRATIAAAPGAPSLPGSGSGGSISAPSAHAGAAGVPLVPGTRRRLMEAGEPVYYLSRSSNQWIPAVVQGHAAVHDGGGSVEVHYRLDIQPDAPEGRVQPRSPDPQAQPSAQTQPHAVAVVAQPAGQPQVQTQPHAVAVVAQPAGQPQVVGGFGANLACATQRGYGPAYWGVTLEQLKEITTDRRFQPGMTTRDAVDCVVRPLTAGSGTGYAMFKNAACPLRAVIMVSHAWDEAFADLISAISASGEQGPFWICATALYQAEDLPELTIEKQLGVEAGGPMVSVLQGCSSLICIVTPGANVYSRLWCLFEMFTACQVGVEIRVSKKHKGFSWAVLDDALINAVRVPVDSLRARCGRLGEAKNADEEAIRGAIEASQDSYRAVDRVVEEARLAELVRGRDRLCGGGWKDTEIGRQYGEAIDIVKLRIARMEGSLPAAPGVQVVGAAPAVVVDGFAGVGLVRAAASPVDPGFSGGRLVRAVASPMDASFSGGGLVRAAGPSDLGASVPAGWAAPSVGQPKDMLGASLPAGWMSPAAQETFVATAQVTWARARDEDQATPLTYTPLHAAEARASSAAPPIVVPQRQHAPLALPAFARSTLGAPRSRSLPRAAAQPPRARATAPSASMLSARGSRHSALPFSASAASQSPTALEATQPLPQPRAIWGGQPLSASHVLSPQARFPSGDPERLRTPPPRLQPEGPVFGMPRTAQPGEQFGLDAKSPRSIFQGGLAAPTTLLVAPSLGWSQSPY